MEAQGTQLGSSLLSSQLHFDGLATQLILSNRETVKQNGNSSKKKHFYL